MTNKNNISQFDELFKEGLNSLDVQAPAAAFDTISKNLSNNGSVFSKLLASKWIVGTIISIATVSTILVANFENSEKLEPLTVNEAQTKSIETAEKNQIEIVETIINQPSIKDNDRKNSRILNKDNHLIATENSTSPKYTISSGTDFQNLPSNTKNATVSNETVIAADFAKSVDYKIIIEGKPCKYAFVKVSLDKKVENIVWMVNGEEQNAKPDNFKYLFANAGKYEIACESNGKLLAKETLIIGLVAGKIVSNEIGNSAMELNANISGYTNCKWIADNNVLSQSRKLVYDNQLYKEVPYFVTTDANGCSDTFYSDTDLEAPIIKFSEYNVITPNADGKNDYYDFEISNVFSFSMTVLNNKNQVVFVSKDAKTKWNGTNFLTQNIADEGTYNLVFTYQRSKNADPETKVITVKLIK